MNSRVSIILVILVVTIIVIVIVIVIIIVIVVITIAIIKSCASITATKIMVQLSHTFFIYQSTSYLSFFMILPSIKLEIKFFGLPFLLLEF